MTVFREISLALEVGLLVAFVLIVAASVMTQRQARTRAYRRSHWARHA